MQYRIGWRQSKNLYIRYLQRQAIKKRVYMALGLALFIVMYTLASTSDAQIVQALNQ